jgi:transketolase
MKLEPIPEKFRVFGWNVIEADGHNMKEILDSFEKAKSAKGAPNLIVFRTILGKGVSYMENKFEWHGTPPNAEQAKQALEELAKNN